MRDLPILSAKYSLYSLRFVEGRDTITYVDLAKAEYEARIAEARARGVEDFEIRLTYTPKD